MLLLPHTERRMNKYVLLLSETRLIIKKKKKKKLLKISASSRVYIFIRLLGFISFQALDILTK